MLVLTRRSALVSAISYTASAGATEDPLPLLYGGNALQKFVQQVNQLWRREHYERQLHDSQIPSRTYNPATLDPPQQLVPFADWDYYYTRGLPAAWHPNPGQTYKGVRVPSGFVTDLASIPQWAWSAGIRPEGRYAYAAIVHDYLYWTQERPREEADEIFLFGMEDSAVDKSLRTRIYNAVRLAGGSSWDKNAELKRGGEKRILREFPPSFLISWREWKQRSGVFVD